MDGFLLVMTRSWGNIVATRMDYGTFTKFTEVHQKWAKTPLLKGIIIKIE